MKTQNLICCVLAAVAFAVTAPLAFAESNTSIRTRLDITCGIENPGNRALTDEERACVGEEWASKIDAIYAADGAADGRRLASDGDFRFLVIDEAWGGKRFPGITCLFDVTRDVVKVDLFLIDVIDGAGDRVWRGYVDKYMRAHNAAIVEHPDYPDKDLCRRKGAKESAEERTFLILEEWKARADQLAGGAGLTHFVRQGSLSRARKALKLGADPNEEDKWNVTPLQYAALKGDAAMVNLLLANGAVPRGGGGEHGATTLLFGIVGGNALVVQSLLRAGGDVEESSHALRYSDTDRFVYGYPLSAALENGDRPIAGILLRAGADPNFFGDPLFYAIRSEDLKLVKLVVDAGANAKGVVLRINGMSPVQQAAEASPDKIFKYLFANGAVIDARSAIESEAWERALAKNRTEVLRHLVRFGSNINFLADQKDDFLHIVEAGTFEDIDQSLAVADKRAASLNEAISAGDLAAVKAAFSSYGSLSQGRKKIALMLATDELQVEIANYLLGIGADPDAVAAVGNMEWLRGEASERDREKARGKATQSWGWKTIPGETALDTAFSLGPLEMVEALLPYSKRVFDNHSDPDPILTTAIEGYYKHKDRRIIEKAMQVGGAPKKSGFESEFFLASLCDRFSKNSLEDLAYFLELGYRPRQREDSEYESNPAYDRLGPSVFACAEHGAAFTLALLDAGADPFQLDQSGSTLLYEIVDYDTERFEDLDFVLLRHLLKTGLNPNHISKFDRNTVLDYALWRVSYFKRRDRMEEMQSAEQVVELLRSYGAKTWQELVAEGVVEEPKTLSEIIPVP